MKTKHPASAGAFRTAFCLALALFLASAAPLLAARSGEDLAREMWMGGYLKYEEASRIETAGNQVLALDLYREALAVFVKVQTRYSDWNPSLLDYRMNYCREHIRRLEAVVAAKSVSLSKENLVSLTQSQDARLRELSRSEGELKKRLELAEKSLEQARSEAAAKVASAADTDRILQENAALRQAGLAAVQREEKLKAEVEGLRSESGLKQKHAELQQTLDVTLAAKAELERGEKEYKASVARLSSQLRDASIARERAEAEAKPLAAALRTAKTELAAREDAVAVLRKEADARKKQQAKDEKTLAALREEAESFGREKAKLEEDARKKQQVKDEKVIAVLRAEVESFGMEKAKLEENARKKQQAKDEKVLAALRTEMESLGRENAKLEVALREAVAKRAVKEGEPAAALLAQYEVELKKAREAADAVKKTLVEKERLIADAVEQLNKFDDDNGRLNRQADVLQKKNAEQAAALSAAAGQLNKFDDDNGRLNRQLDALQKKNAEQAALLTSAAGQLNKFDDDNGRLNRELDVLQKKNAEQAAALSAVGQKQAGDIRIEELTRDLDAARKTGAAAAVELGAVKAKYEQGLPLAKSSLEKIESLEKVAAAQTKALADNQEKVKTLEADLKLARDRITVTEGLLPGKGDVQAAMAALMTRITKAEGDNVMLETRLKDTVRDLDAARKSLGAERLARAAGGEPMMEQLRNLNRELDQERDKGKALEQTVEDMKTRLALLPAAPAVSAAPASAASPEDDRRRADRTAMANGFLQGGVSAEKQGKTEAAVWNYRKVLEYQPDNRLACKRLGILASRNGNQDEAESYLRRAFYLDPDDVDVLLPLGFALVRQSKPDLAVSMLARAASLRPEDTAIHGAYGVACSQLGWRDAAESQFRRTLALNPKDKNTAFNLAVLLASSNPPRLQEAQQWYKRARELGIPADPGLDKLFSAGE